MKNQRLGAKPRTALEQAQHKKIIRLYTKLLDLSQHNRSMQEKLLRLEQENEEVYCQTGADAYVHATDLLNDWRKSRTRARKASTGNLGLCDSLGVLFDLVNEREEQIAQLKQQVRELKAKPKPTKEKHA